MRRLAKLVPSLFLGLMPLASADAGSTTYARKAGWLITKGEADCTAGFTLDRGGGIFLVMYDYGLNSVRIAVTDRALQSVQQGEEFQLKLYFINRGRLDEGWGTVKATGFRSDDDDHMPGLVVQLNGTDALNDLAASSTVALFRDDVVVESVSLTGSAAAVASLKSCAREVHRENPSDPLAGAPRTRSTP